MQTDIAIQYINIDDLIYDPLNPRLPSTIVQTGKESDVINWMLTDAAILELMGSIGEKGFFPAEPLLAIASKTQPGKFEVVEGNRRLTAAKLLKDPSIAQKRKGSIKILVDEAKQKPISLPVFVFDQREEILDYLGFKHITGVKPWSALAKAKYLQQLQAGYTNDKIKEQYKSLAKAIGSRSDYVRDLLVGLSLYEKIHEADYYDIEGLNEETIDFGVYYTALSRSNIPTFLGVDKNSDKPTQNINTDNLKEFTEWVSKKNPQGVTRLGESRNLTKLNQIVVNNQALAAFRAGKDIDSSLLYTEEPEKLFSISILESNNKLVIANSLIHRLQTVLMSDVETLTEIYSIADSLKFLLEKKRGELSN
ncbi:MAG: hypothetical protein EOO20_05055 [Chryseobacterium sp.]|nr:MAG: hypothetical protein EOO20_05055 [Chryseobacterium sp.]